MSDVSGTTRIFLSAFLALSLAATGCSSKSEVEVSESAAGPALERARAATDELARRLLTELGEQLEAGTPAAAITVCSRIAPLAASELSRDGLEIRRTSLRLRNPDNAPDAWERAWLARLEETVAGGEAPAEVHEIDPDRREVRYLRPILVGAGCLLCHGPEDRLDPEVRRRLVEIYPEDRAIGFSAGDLRGAFSVRVRLD